MKRKLLMCLFILSGIYTFAQNDSLEKKEALILEKEKLTAQKLTIDNSLKKIESDLLAFQPVKYWNINGTNSIIFNQNTFSNWIAGGINSFGVNARLNYDLNYKKGNHIWENKIILGYGQISNENEKPRKTEDIISLSSTYGRKIAAKWYVTLGTTFLTQFVSGFDYAKTPDARNGEQISNFMAPGYLTIGLGFDYKPNNNFQAYFRPATSKMTFVTDKTLQLKGNYGLENNGDSFRYELGTLAGARYRGKINDNITFDNVVSFFSNYLDQPERIDIAYTGQLNMKINKFITSQLTLDLLYDHDQITKTQLKNSLGVGFAYNLVR